jgi:hypothetical protein
VSVDLAITIEDPAQSELLSRQTIGSAVLIAYGAASHDPSVRELAAAKGWEYKQRNSLRDAVQFARTTFIVEWDDVYQPDPKLLANLVATAEENPVKMGAIAPNFDGVIVWRTAALRGPQGTMKGLANGSVHGFTNSGRLAPGMVEEQMDIAELRSSATSSDWSERHAAALNLAAAADPDRRELQRRLLDDPDTAVIEAMAEGLIRSEDPDSMALVCEALARASDHVGDHVLSLLVPLWKGDGIDLPSLLNTVTRSSSPDARRGATEAREWLGLVD